MKPTVGNRGIPVVCRKCGAQIPEDSVFCENCGASVSNMDQRVKKRRPIPLLLAAFLLAAGGLYLLLAESLLPSLTAGKLALEIPRPGSYDQLKYLIDTAENQNIAAIDDEVPPAALEGNWYLLLRVFSTRDFKTPVTEVEYVAVLKPAKGNKLQMRIEPFSGRNTDGSVFDLASWQLGPAKAEYESRFLTLGFRKHRMEFIFSTEKVLDGIYGRFFDVAYHSYGPTDAGTVYQLFLVKVEEELASSAGPLIGSFVGPWGSLRFLEGKKVLVSFGEPFDELLQGRPNKTEYQYVFTQGSFGEVDYNRADIFVLIHEDFRENLSFACPSFPNAQRLVLYEPDVEPSRSTFVKE